MDQSARHAKAKSIFSLGALTLQLVDGVFAGGKYAIDQMNTVEFCVSCHEMRENNFEEYKDTIHAKNRTDVKAICSDCRVPHDFVCTTIRKIKAANDAFHHLAGTVETPEKFEAHRLELAKRVWARMKETDSQECRHCHDIRAMDPEKQGKTAQKLASGERTCIEPTRNRPVALNPAMPWPTNLSSARRKLKTEACEF